jgi:hypothetical protein
MGVFSQNFAGVLLLISAILMSMWTLRDQSKPRKTKKKPNKKGNNNMKKFKAAAKQVTKTVVTGTFFTFHAILCSVLGAHPALT